MQSEPSSDLSDVSQVFRPADILGIPQAIKGFGKLEILDIISISQITTDLRYENDI
jgi:hypothetical protein